MSHRNPSASPRIRALETLAYWLDEVFVVPGLGWRFGLDPVIGLIPGLGNVVGSLVSLIWVFEAWRVGAGPSVLFQMFGNIAVEMVIGVVPVFGNLFDASWKANRRNMTLLRAYAEDPDRTTRASRRWSIVVLGLALTGFLAMATLVIAVGVAMARWLITQ